MTNAKDALEWYKRKEAEKMAQELEPCPFCNSKDYGSHEPDCYFTILTMFHRDKYISFGMDVPMNNDVSGEQLKEAWNHRYKQTCKMIYEESEPWIHLGKWTCSECGAWAMRPPYDWSRYKFCPQCGSKICGAEVSDGD